MAAKIKSLQELLAEAEKRVEKTLSEMQGMRSLLKGRPGLSPYVQDWNAATDRRDKILNAIEVAREEAD